MYKIHNKIPKIFYILLTLVSCSTVFHGMESHYSNNLHKCIEILKNIELETKQHPSVQQVLHAIINASDEHNKPIQEALCIQIEHDLITLQQYRGLFKHSKHATTMIAFELEDFKVVVSATVANPLYQSICATLNIANSVPEINNPQDKPAQNKK